MKRKNNHNVFITLEGGEGSGKTTISHALTKKLREYGFSVIETSEPGGTAFGDEIKKLIMNQELDDITEALLFAAARHEHCKFLLETLNEDTTKPTIIICDRYVLSSIAYQGNMTVSRAGGPEVITKLNAIADILTPDRTYFIDVKPEEGMKRIRNRAHNNRFDLKGKTYHEAIYDDFKKAVFEGEYSGFQTKRISDSLSFCQSFSTGKIVSIDGMRDIDSICKDIMNDLFTTMDRPVVKPGDRVEIIQLGNDEPHYKPGDKGTVGFIDDAHSIHVKWDNGGSIALLPECDTWKKL